MNGGRKKRKKEKQTRREIIERKREGKREKQKGR